jgi:hypothetical protein
MEMRGERGLTTGETVIAATLCVVLFVAGLGIGGAFDSESSGPPAEPPIAPSPAGTEWTGEPSSEELAALSQATAGAREEADAGRGAAREGVVAGAAATAAVLTQEAKAREAAAERAAYWAAAGTAINSLHGLAARMERLRGAEQVKRSQALLRRLQARTLFALGRLRQMRVSAERRRLATLLVAGIGQALDQSLSQAERALGAATARAANQAARELSRTGASLNRTLAMVEGFYIAAAQAALSGNEAVTDEQLDRLESAAGQL